MALSAALLLPAQADYKAEILSENPIVYYRFNDGVATAAPDVAANLGSLGAGGNGRYLSSITHATTGALIGSPNKAATFTNRGMLIPYNPALNNAGSFTMEAWLKPAAVPAAAGFFCAASSMHVADPRAGWLLYQGDDATGWTFRTYNQAGTNFAVNLTSGPGITAGNWYHVVATWDNTAGVGKLYVNGNLVGTSAAGLTYVANADSQFTLGSRSDNGFGWQGSIDEPAYYNKVLSLAEVQSHYNNGVSASPATPYNSLVLATGPVGYWRLDEPVYNPVLPVATNQGNFGPTGNGAYHGGAMNVPGPSPSNGFIGLEAGNTAVTLDGIDSYVGSALGLLNNRTAFTVMGWVRRPSVSPSARGGYFGQNDILEFGEADANGSNIEAWINATGGNIKAPNLPTDNSWGFIVLTGDGTTNTLYVNGEPVGTRPAVVTNYGTNEFKFNVGGGGIFAVDGDFFSGAIDEVAVFDKAVTAGRVKQFYGAALGTVLPSAPAPTVAPSAIIRQGDPYTLTVDSAGTPPLSYQWQVDGVDIPGAQSLSYTVANAAVHSPNPATPFLYTVRITNGAGSITTTGTQVTVAPGLIWTSADAGTPGVWDQNVTFNWKLFAAPTPAKYTDSYFVKFDDTAATTAVTLSGALAPAGVVFDNPTKAYTLTGVGIGGIQGVTKKGGGTATLANANTYTGTTRVEAGVLSIGNGTAGSIAATSPVEVVGGDLQLKQAAGTTYENPTVVSGGQLSYRGTGGLTSTAVISGAGNLLFDRQGTVVLNAANTLGGTVVINSGTAAFDGGQNFNRLPSGKLVTVNAAGTMEVRGVNALPSAANAVNVTVLGGRLNFVSGGSAAIGTDGTSHAHIGAITLNGGTLHFDYSGAGGAYDAEGAQLNGNILVTGTAPSVIDWNPATCNPGNSGLALIGTKSFTVEDVTGGPGVDLTVSAEIENNDAGGAILEKNGAGTMAITVPASYSGGTTVIQGTLLVNNTTESGTGSGAVTVNAAGTLGGSGVISGGVTSAGTLAPGSGGVGTLSTGAMTASGTYVCEVSDTTADKVLVGGDLNISGATLNVVAIGDGSVGPHVIAEYTGILTGTFGTVNGGYTVKYNQGALSNQITIEGVPTAYALWAQTNVNGQAANLDFDNDGIQNGVEYFMGPAGNGVAGHPVPVSGSVTWPRDPTATVRAFKIQTSTTLAAGSWTDVVPPNASIDLSNPSKVKFTLPTGSAKRFCRLVVTP